MSWKTLKTTQKSSIVAFIIYVLLALIIWTPTLFNNPEGYMGTSYGLFFIGFPMAFLAALFDSISNTLLSMLLMTIFGAIEYIIVGYFIGRLINKRS